MLCTQENRGKYACSMAHDVIHYGRNSSGRVCKFFIEVLRVKHDAHDDDSRENRRRCSSMGVHVGIDV